MCHYLNINSFKRLFYGFISNGSNIVSTFKHLFTMQAHEVASFLSDLEVIGWRWRLEVGRKSNEKIALKEHVNIPMSHELKMKTTW